VITPQWIEPTAAEREELGRFAADLAHADGVGAFSEPTLLDLATPTGHGRHLVVRGEDGAVVGWAHVDESDPDDVVVELGVAPAARRRGVARALAVALAADDDARPGRIRVWAHGDRVGSADFAADRGLVRERELWMMRRPSGVGPLPEQRPVEGVSIVAFEPGRDEDDVVAVNARAFAWHPEQGAMTADDVRRREQEPWFDAAGFLLAREEATGRLLGFHWTKRHPEGRSGDDGPIGEVYVVGVDPDAQGRGLGRALTLAGLHHLAGRGLDEVILYVEADNVPAVTTYRHLGFEVDAADVSYRLPPS
jgi:mycothiol synthase